MRVFLFLLVVTGFAQNFPLPSQASRIVDQLLVNLHPYNEYPGWVEHFTIKYRLPRNQEGGFDSPADYPLENYWLTNQHLQFVNNPKTWTVWFY